MRAGSFVFAALALAGAPACQSQGAASGGTGLCAAGEVAYFSCAVARGRTLSLCGRAPEALQYRFGKPGAIELQYPQAAADGARRFAYAHYSRYQVDRIELSFQTTPGNEYVLYDYTEERKQQAGVRVTAAGGKEQDIGCTGAVVSRLPELQPLLPCDRDNALNGGACR